ncbi:hypothetical protein F0562_004334 [Nyssa sinensis]|uniref:DUF4378 domain-containing protein n=1 Tax=Nyssa sinensis TaxID=561372 RepID=A0A5J5BXT7_9ASTE|nr:hypothetical protein F0562_004334 [Nyssa sinensis]
MSANLLHSLTDENRDLQKQIGCMNGIFQLFDRHHFLSRRRVGGQKRLPAAQTANHGLEPNSTTQKATVKNQEEEVKEKQRVSIKSPRTSFSSSSCSSTFSSVDCNRTAQPEPSFSGHSIFPETPSRILTTKQPNSSSHLVQQSLDLRDIVKDSIYREARGLSVRTINKEERTRRVVKYIDSPRPLQPCTSVEPKVSGLDGSFRVLSKHREASWNSNEEKDVSPLLTSRDVSRFSCDGRETRDTLKSKIKLKELPRLSLDSRAGSIRNCVSESRSNYLLGDVQQGNGSSNKVLINRQQEPGSNKRPSSVVAKLMGLEVLPDSMSINEDQTREIKSCPGEDSDAISRFPRTADESKQSQVSGSPRISHRDPASPRLRNANSVMKPTSSSKIPLEPAPWRQAEGSRGSSKPAFMYRESPTKAPNLSPSVYGEIEKRLTELEFKKSGKDLRALKRILEAMQKTRESLESKKEPAANFEPQTSNYGRNYSSLNWSPKLTSQPISPSIKGTSPPERLGSPAVIIKPIVEKTRNSGSSASPIDSISGLRKLQTGDTANSRKDSSDKRTAKDLTPRNNHLRDPPSQPLRSMDKNTGARTLRSTQTSKAPQHMPGASPASSRRSSGTLSPRLQQKKHEMEKQCCPTTPSSDSNRTRRQSSKQPIDSGSPGRKLKPKSPNLQQGNDQLSEISSDTRNLSHQGDAISVQSESNISSASQIDSEVSSMDHSNEIHSIYQQKDKKNNNLAARLSEDKSMAELTIATLEQPSPVSVLDATFYKEDSPSPVKKISNAFKDDETLSDEAEWKSVDLDHILNSTRPSLSSDFDHKKLENIKHLVHKLRRLNSTHDEATTDYIASLCEDTNPDHRYITEILLASGLLLKDLSSSLTTIQLHSLGHLINPNLFLVLEQTKGSTKLPNHEHSNEKIIWSKPNEKTQRKLVFDTVNEILVRKLASTGSSELWISPNELGGRSLSGQKLLKELCSEMDCLQTNKNCSLDHEDDGWISISSEDMMHENWAGYHGEVAGLVLDIERLIFKDLIGEVVSGEAAGPGRQNRHCRQLFSK